MKQFSILFLSWIVIANLVVSCGSKNDDQLAKAQKCLNNAQTPTDANACSEILGDMTGDRANRIRCGIVVLQAGLTQDRIINSLAAIDTPGQDPIIEIGTGLAIGDTAGDVTTATDAQAICNQTSSKGLQLVANLIVFGTEAAVAAATNGCGAPPNPPTGAYNTCVASSMNPVDMPPAQAGTFAINTFQIYCVPTFTDTKICTSLQSSGAGAASPDPVAVGTALQACLMNNTCQ